MKPRFQPGQLDRIAAFLATRAGLAFPDNRRRAAEAELLREMERVGLGDPERYLEALDEGGPLLDELLGRLTVGETYFFREPQQLERIRSEVLPALAQSRRGHPIRVWSAGCASGEEPYTLAIMLAQAGLLPQARILGTDVSRDRLLHARRARYRQWSFRGVPPEITGQYFERRGEEWGLRPELRRAVEFRYLNLAEDVYPSISTGVWGLDLILCRNVLIYFTPETVARVAARLVDALGTDGWLFVGASDPPLEGLAPCEAVRGDYGVAYRRAGAQPKGRGSKSRISRPEALPTPRVSAPQPEVALPRPAEDARPSAPAPAPPAAEPAIETARARYAAREYLQAIRAAEEAAAADPSRPEAEIIAVRALANRGELTAAGRRLSLALERHPFTAELCYLQAILLGAAGEWAASADAARRAAYLDRTLVVAHLAAGTALSKLGRRNAARAAFATAARLLARESADAEVPASDGETAGRLAEMAQVQLRLLGSAA